jgi:hypothetical protein
MAPARMTKEEANMAIKDAKRQDLPGLLRALRENRVDAFLLERIAKKEQGVKAHHRRSSSLTSEDACDFFSPMA